jgi:hypothetical protein
MSNSDSPHIFKPFLGKNRIFAIFRFNIQYAFPESEKRFFVSKISNSDSLHVLPLEGSFPGKIFHVGGATTRNSSKIFDGT